MSSVPPTSPGPLPSRSGMRNHRILLGVLIHGGCVFIACFVAPIVGGSNIWPIAGVFWSVMTVPVAAGIGALTGWIVRKRSQSVALSVLVSTGVVMAAVAGVVMASNQ